MPQLTLPDGEVVEFGPAGYSRELVEFLALCRGQMAAGDDAAMDDASGLRMLELIWHIAVSSLRLAGHTQEQAEGIMARIPLTKDYSGELRRLVGLGAE